jgi:uncharacterized protein YndB with AHSA1/START domain
MSNTPANAGTAAASSDKIEKQIFLRAPRARVWRALSNEAEFGTLFGMAFEGPFVAGQPVRAKIMPTQVDADVARQQKPYEGRPAELTVESIEPEKLISFRWHPFAIEPGIDYSSEPTTLIVFALKEQPGGVLLTITESGFDRIPLARRAKAFAANDSGWTTQLALIEKYLAQST